MSVKVHHGVELDVVRVHHVASSNLTVKALIGEEEAELGLVTAAILVEPHDSVRNGIGRIEKFNGLWACTGHVARVDNGLVAIVVSSCPSVVVTL